MLEREEYIFTCPTKKDCEIREIRVSLDPSLLDCFGFNCPFCKARMKLKGRVPKAPKYLTCYMCEQDNGGHCFLVDNPKKNEDLGMPSCCPYGLNVYADFTAEPLPRVVKEECLCDPTKKRKHAGRCKL